MKSTIQHRNTQPASAALLQLLVGSLLSQAVSAAAHWNVAEALAAGPKTAREIAELIGVHPVALHRLLRMLASAGVFHEDEQQRFANTPASEALRDDAPDSIRSFARFWGDRRNWDAHRELTASVQSGQAAFPKVYGKEFFDYLAEDPELARIFDDAMTGMSAQEVPAVIEAIDFSAIKRLCDIGGGRGSLLTSILRKNPQQQGILFDMPYVIDHAKSLVEASGMGPRCEVVGGDFFVQVPAGADGYLLKHVLHDWDDERCHTILETIRRAAEPDARLFVLDAVITPGNDSATVKVLDLEMLLVTSGGRERTVSEFQQLFEAARFELVQWVPTAAPTCAVIEARAV